MIHQSYDLNQYIPNIENILYKIFCSPIVTEEQRKAGKDKNNLLLGNIFADMNIQLPMDVYKSLLQTIQVRPKKKHYKKIIEYIRKIEPNERVTPALLDQIINIGITHQYPVTLGQ